MKRTTAAAVTLSLLVLVGCGTDDEAPIATTNPPSTSSSTTSTSTSLPEPTEVDTSAPAAPEVAAEQAVVVECLPGTPGPARWSDGSTRFSQWCWDTQGGAVVGEAEQSAGLPPADEPVYDSSGEAQMANGCAAGYIDPETCAAYGY